MPVAAGFASLANGELGYDSTNKNWHGWANGLDYVFALIPTSGITNGDCVQFSLSAGFLKLTDAGGACGLSGGGGPPTGAAGGDLGGTYPNPSVAKIGGVPLCTGISPSNGQNLQYTTASSPNPCYTTAAGGGVFPQFVQEGYGSSNASTTSYVYTFPQALQASGATAFMLMATDGSQSISCPSGWTQDFTQAATTYARIMLCHKTSNGATTATWTAASATSFAVYLFELSGSHALDQSATSTSGNTNVFTFPTITPSSGALVMAGAAGVSGTSFAPSQTVTAYLTGASSSPNWGYIWVGGTSGSNNQRFLIGEASLRSPSGTVLPPLINTSGISQFTSGGVALATFSIL
jgi:hypothetical protein